MHTIEFPANALRAVARFADDKDFREQLKYVHIEATPNGARLIATNGHCLAMYQTSTNMSGPAHVTVLAADVVAATKAWSKSLPNIPLVIDGAQSMLGDLRVTLSDNVKAIEYERVVPPTCSNEPASYAVNYVRMFRDAAADLGRRNADTSVHINHNGNSAAVIGISGDPFFLGLLMPYHGNEHNAGDARPEWYAPAHEPVAVTA